MKNIHPLEVTPMLGSAPGSPTSLKTKFIGSGSAETFRPSGPVTNVPSGIEGSSGGSSFTLSSSRQPEKLLAQRMRLIAIARTSNLTFYYSGGTIIIVSYNSAIYPEY
jgi:hypothetical protein